MTASPLLVPTTLNTNRPFIPPLMLTSTLQLVIAIEGLMYNETKQEKKKKKKKKKRMGH